MSPRRRALNALSWFVIALALLAFLAGASFSWLSIDLIASGTVSIEAVEVVEDAASGTAELVGPDEAIGALALLFCGVLLVLFGAVYLVVGILGHRGAKNPRTIVPFMVLSTVGVLFAASDLFVMVSAAHFDPLSTAVMLASFALPAAGMYLAFSIRLRREDVPEGEVAGPDGPAFNDGFDPRKLGFMRVLQVFFAVNIVISVLSLTTLAKGSYEINFNELLDLFNVVVDGVLFWFIWQRYRSTRRLAIGLGLFNIFVGTGYNLATGAFDFGTQLSLCAGDIVVLLYFLTSRRAKAVLTAPFATDASEREAAHRAFYNPRSWAFWRSVVIYFCLFSIVGHWMEAAFCLLIKYGIVPGIYDPNSQIWSDWLYPFPVYGFGTVACILVLYPVKGALQRRLRSVWAPLAVSFVVNTVVCAAIELALGLLQNQPVDGVYPLWDYSDMFCNFMGQICLQNSLAFGAVATIMTWIVYPTLEKLMGRLSRNAANVLFIVVVVFFALVFSLYCVNVAIPGMTPEESSALFGY